MGRDKWNKWGVRLASRRLFTLSAGHTVAAYDRLAQPRAVKSKRCGERVAARKHALAVNCCHLATPMGERLRWLAERVMETSTVLFGKSR